MNLPETASIEIGGLTKRFGSLVAVNGITFSCPRGTTFGLLGPNGAGKTTLIRMLTTLFRPTSGSARVDGIDILLHPTLVRWRIGYVSQMVSADGDLTSYENLLISAKVYLIPSAERHERIMNALEFMQLADVKDKLVRQYSGGMIRRLEIAQAMLHHPRVLFLDEPTVGLDPSAKRRVWESIRQLRSQFGTTILMTTHDMEEADELCQLIGVMHRGVMVALDSPASLKGHVSPTATLHEAFIHFTGSEFSEGGELKDVSRSRLTARRLG